MKRTSCVTNLCVGLLFALGACSDGVATATADPPSGDVPTGPFQLTFQGDASFQDPHGGQAITVALVRMSDGAVVAGETGIVSAGADPTFSFTFSGLLVVGVAYEVHYWIDSNFDGGIAGACDPTENDHQWNVAVAAVTADVTIAEVHDAANTVDVCTTFATP